MKSVGKHLILTSQINLYYSRAVVTLREDDLGDVLKVLQTYSTDRIHDMRQQVEFYFNRYFRTIKDITLTTLQIINDRVFPYAGRKYEEWNDFPRQVSRSSFLCDDRLIVRTIKLYSVWIIGQDLGVAFIIEFSSLWEGV